MTHRNKERKEIIPSPYDGFDIIGIFDLIFKKENGKITVIDWKTNKTPRDATKQLSFYFYILKLIGEIPERQTTFECSIVYLCVDVKEDYIIAPYKIDELDLEASMARLDGFVRRAKVKGTNKEKYTKSPGPLCPWCDYYQAGVCKGKDALDSD